jgi:hypothetical protein
MPPAGGTLCPVGLSARVLGAAALVMEHETRSSNLPIPGTSNQQVPAAMSHGFHMLAPG